VNGCLATNSLGEQCSLEKDHGYVAMPGSEKVFEHFSADSSAYWMGDYGMITDKDMVNHPPHYNAHPSGIECIEITRHMNFNLGNVIKYLWRSDHKDAELEDLKKAAWYLNDEIERLEKTDG
jgi:hypothetical protein